MAELPWYVGPRICCEVGNGVGSPKADMRRTGGLRPSNTLVPAHENLRHWPALYIPIACLPRNGRAYVVIPPFEAWRMLPVDKSCSSYIRHLNIDGMATSP